MKCTLPPAAWRLGVVLLLLAARPAESALFSTIITNGPTTNRVNLVLFSEGYTNGQWAAFLNDATNAANSFLSAEPYAEYSNYFNVFAIFTNSAHAGSTHLNQNAFATNYTFFNSTYDANNNYYVTIPPNVSDLNPQDGQGKINSLLWTNYRSIFPSTSNNLPALLVNDSVSGGSDGGSVDYGLTAISSLGNVGYILVHESGHTLGALGDEYTASYPGFPDIQEPNTTTNTNYVNIQWSAWIHTNTPLPTPLSIDYVSSVGLFQGAHYHTSGWYRPCENCIMGSDGVGFCPVCQEALVRAIYGKVRPLDGHWPPTNGLTVTLPQPLTFSLALLQPATHNLSVQWRTNGVAVGRATNSSLSVSPLQLGNGTNKVEADIWDGTSLVRTDALNLLKQTNLWTLNTAVPVMQFQSFRWLTNGSFAFMVTGSAPASVVIELSTNLVQWTPVQTSSFSGGRLFYTNQGAAAVAKRFFRAKSP